MTTLKNITFNALIIIIVVIVAVDCFWTIETQEIILENEQNPVAKFIITHSGGKVSLLIALKFINTFFIATFLQKFYLIDKLRNKTFATAVGILAFHFWLLYYLLYAKY